MSRLKVTECKAPLLLLSLEEQHSMREQGLRALQLRFPTLASINRKYSNAGGRFHTNIAYKRQEQQVQELVVTQVLAANWTVTKDDTYHLIYDLAFPDNYRQDSDGPLKATTDCLHPSLSRSERKHLSQAQIDLWNQLNPPAIYNDSRIKQFDLVKHVRQTDLTCTITIYAFTTPYHYVPVHQLILQYLLEARGISLAGKGNLLHEHLDQHLRPAGSGTH